MIKKEEITLKQIEPAKTGRSKCKSCNNTIEKNTLRVGISYSEQAGGAKWYHLTCFPLKDVVASADELEGFTTLNENEQNSVREQMNVTIAPIRCASGDKFIDPPNLEELSENDKNEISSIKIKIEEIKAVTAEKLREFLTENAQYSAGTKGELLIRAADVIVRGCIPKCSKCEKGFLFWSESTQDYFCKGHTDEETKAVVKCDAVFTKDQINRTPAVISDTFWQKKERKRKVTVTTVIEKVDEKKEEQPEDEEPDTGMRKKRKSAGVRKWNNDFIYDKEDSEEQVESVEDEADQEFVPNPNEAIEDNQPIDQDEPEEEPQQPPQQSNFFNTVIGYNNQVPNNTNNNPYYNDNYFQNGN